MWRVKFLLEDGRKVYVSKRGKIDPYSERDIQDLLSEEIRLGGYAPSLSVYYGALSLERLKPEHVAVTGLAIELMESEVDREAYLLGGVRAR